MRSRKLASVVRPAAQGEWTGRLDHSKEAEGTQLFQLKKNLSSGCLVRGGQCVGRKRVRQLCNNPGEEVVA